MSALDANETLFKTDLHNAVHPAAQSKDVGDVIQAALLRSEIRRSVANLSPEEIEVLYRTCGDANICRALEELPSITKTKDGAIIVKRLVSDELREEVLRDEGRRLRPVSAERLDDINEIRGVYATVASSLRREVEKAAPVVFEPAVKVS